MGLIRHYPIRIGAASTDRAIADRGSSPIREAQMDSAHLLKELPGFKSGFAKVNGIRLHYVDGGNGAPLILLPGWLQTWWEYHKVMPALAKHFHVIVVDIRGMGDSDRPAGGYDKKTMAQDVSELVKSFGFEKVNIAGHDVGGQVVFSFVANHPDQSIRAAMMDVIHPDDSFYKIPILPEEGKFGEKVDDLHPKVSWWIAFNQVRGLPEQAPEGRFHFVQDWVFDYAIKDKNLFRKWTAPSLRRPTSREKRFARQTPGTKRGQGTSSMREHMGKFKFHFWPLGQPVMTA